MTSTYFYPTASEYQSQASRFSQDAITLVPLNNSHTSGPLCILMLVLANIIPFYQELHSKCVQKISPKSPESIAPVTMARKKLMEGPFYDDSA